MNNVEPLKIFHLLGSPDSHLLSQLSVSYSRAVAELADDQQCTNGDGPNKKKYEFKYAFLHHDGMVSLLSALDEVSVSRDCTRKHKFSFLLAEISTYNPDVIVYHILGRTGCTVYRSAIETLGIPILGSSSDKHFITTNKVLTRAILRSAAISIAPGVELYNSTDVGEDSNAEAVSEIERKCFGGDNSGYPVVVKASTVEDSIGVFLAYDRQQLLHYIKKAFELSPEGVAVERFIAGREIRSLVIEEADGNMKILPIVEYDIGGSNNIRGTKSKIQVEDYETTGKVSCKTGSEIFLEEQPFNAKLIEAVKRESFKAFRTLQLRNFAIFDMRVDESGRPYILEVNLYCAFNRNSKVNAGVKKAGITDTEYFEMTLQNVLRGRPSS